MSEELICPDCDGVIGGTPGTGRAVCRCFEASRTSSVAPRVEPQEDLSSASSPSVVGEKLCRVCGRDLKGHRRLKDCDAAERRTAEVADAQDLSLIPCPECGRKLKAEGFTTLNGAVMCKSCAADFKELRKYKAAPLTLEVHKDIEKRSLRNLLIVGGVLMLIMVLAWMGWIGR